MYTYGSIPINYLTTFLKQPFTIPWVRRATLFLTTPALAGYAAIFCSFSGCQHAADSDDRQEDPKL